MDGTDRNGEALRADELVEFRLNVKQWPLYEKTRNRFALSPDDRLIFYCGGKRSGGTIFGYGRVLDVVPLANKLLIDECRLTIGPTPKSMIILTDTNKFKTKVFLRTIVSQLECYPKNSNKWGMILQGGCRKISDHDWNYIIKAASKKQVSK
jgi:hypothetical protein